MRGALRLAAKGSRNHHNVGQRRARSAMAENVAPLGLRPVPAVVVTDSTEARKT
jgi:hypothetical protein